MRVVPAGPEEDDASVAREVATPDGGMWGARPAVFVRLHQAAGGSAGTGDRFRRYPAAVHLPPT
jgi:hypothetical protein